MYEYLDFALRRWRKDILAVSRTYYNNLKSLSEHKCTVAVLGLQSSGKSTLLNGIIGYPVLPATEIKCTTCPLLLEYGEQPLLTAITESGAEVKIDGLFTDDVFGKLIDYVCACINEHVVFPENLLYFTSEDSSYNSLSPSNVIMDRKDNRHGLVLAMILLNAYIENDDSNAHISQRRKNLMKLLGIHGRLSTLHLKWPSEAISGDICFIDLPGLGSGSVDKNNEYSLDTIAEQQVLNADVILFMTTAEAIGGRLQQVCRNIYSKPSMYGPPLSAIVINRADELEHASITLNAAKAMLPFMHIPVYMISSISGEYKFLRTSIPVERTLYWRKTFLPEFRKYSQRKDITEADKKSAIDELKELYDLEYEYGHEDIDGNISSLSLDNFINSELNVLCAQRLSQILQAVYRSDPQGSTMMDKLAERDIAFMDKKHEHITYVWGAMAEKTRELLGELEVELMDIAKILESAMNDYSTACEQLRGEINNMVMKINAAFLDKVISAASTLDAKWGLSLFTSIDGQSKNDCAVREIYSVCSVPELMMLMKLANPIERRADEILCSAEKLVSVIVDRIHESLSRFSVKMRNLPDTCMKEAVIFGINKDTFRRYFYVNLYFVAENVVEAVAKEYYGNTSSIGYRGYHIELGLGNRIRRCINWAMKKAVLFRLKGGAVVLRKKKLISELRKTLILSADAELLYSESGLPCPNDASETMLKELYKKYMDARLEIQALTDTLQSVLKSSYQECEQTIEQDNILLNKWCSQVKL